MPTVNIEETIINLMKKHQHMTQELYRIQGMIKTYEDLKRGGLKIIEIPNDPSQISDTDNLESNQEKPE
jgi:phosphate uptake regulator